MNVAVNGNTEHPFDRLAQSTHDFHARFGTAQDVRRAIRICEEEWQEVKAEAKFGIDSFFTVGVAHETADLIVTLIGLCNICGVTDDDLKAAMLEVAAKNDAKIPGVTHEINPVSRKVQRIRRTKN